MTSFDWTGRGQSNDKSPQSQYMDLVKIPGEASPGFDRMEVFVESDSLQAQMTIESIQFSEYGRHFCP